MIWSSRRITPLPLPFCHSVIFTTSLTWIIKLHLPCLSRISQLPLPLYLDVPLPLQSHLLDSYIYHFVHISHTVTFITTSFMSVAQLLLPLHSDVSLPLHIHLLFSYLYHFIQTYLYILRSCLSHNTFSTLVTSVAQLPSALCADISFPLRSSMSDIYLYRLAHICRTVNYLYQFA